MPIWQFKKKQPTDTVREPIQGEFFAGESISDPAEALVREVLQNSLDNASDLADLVRVRFSVLSGDSARSWRELNGLADELGSHLAALGNGLDRPPLADDRCSFLLVEDFGTTGLTGDPYSWDPAEGERNNFYSFFRAEGRSDKSGTAVGRWGVGKFVFPRASRASTLFGFTVPEDTHTKLLMGRSILRSHRVGDATYLPDGYFGEIPRRNDQPVGPIVDAGIIRRFRETFDVRRDDEPGLSVVVPWIHESEFTSALICAACIQDYFFPILSGGLEVTVEVDGVQVLLSPATITNEARRVSVDTHTLGLAEWATNSEADPRPILLPRHSEEGKPAWNISVVPEEIARVILTRLQSGERVAVTVPVVVREWQNGTYGERWSEFSLFLEADSQGGSHVPVYLRSGIRVSGASRKHIAGIRSLVVAESEEIAKLLGDSENPAHTEWRQDTKGFKDRYKFGAGTLEFVKDSVRELMRVARSYDREPDRLLLADLFPAVRDDGGQVRPTRTARSQTPDRSLIDVPVIPRTPARLRIHKVDGGFRLTDGDESAELPEQIRVAAAYAVRRGNPLRKYNAADFDLGHPPIVVTAAQGASVVSCAGNELTILVASRPFLVTVTGFDRNRDVFVRATPS